MTTLGASHEYDDSIQSDSPHLAVALIGSFALGLGATTAAADEAHVPKANIRYGDLNLATSQGAKVLYERIISASPIHWLCRLAARKSSRAR
jgi:UrcA family protein